LLQRLGALPKKQQFLQPLRANQDVNRSETKFLAKIMLAKVTILRRKMMLYRFLIVTIGSVKLTLGFFLVQKSQKQILYNERQKG